MQKSLLWKLIVAFVLVALCTAALVVTTIRLTSESRLVGLIMDQQQADFSQALGEYYATNGSWDGVQAVMDRPWVGVTAYAGPPPWSDSPGEDRRNLIGLADAEGTIIIEAYPGTPVGTKASDEILEAGRAIVVEGNRVGTILVAPRRPSFSIQEAAYLRRSNQSLLLAGGGAIVVALLVGVLLARNLIRPLQALTRAAEHIAHGQLEQQVKVKSRDEIGQLAVAFNLMSQEVVRANALRQQMTVDIAHDLRTPLTVIAGYIEAMRDGVLKATPERLALIYVEIERLQDLVGDLRVLSMAEAGELPLQPQSIAVKALLERAAAPFRDRAEQQQVRLVVEADSPLVEVRVDEARMMQVFGNLLSNALRYTPAGGTITLSVEKTDPGVTIAVRDTGSGIAAEDLPFIFDRFYKSDKARSADDGESGLGLAIVKALVEAHGGKVWAESQPGEGTAVFLRFHVI